MVAAPHKSNVLVNPYAKIEPPKTIIANIARRKIPKNFLIVIAYSPNKICVLFKKEILVQIMEQEQARLDEHISQPGKY
jgi:hypothetical protein